MTGSKMITMTLEEMRATRLRAESQSDWKRVHRMVQDGIEPAEEEGSPNAVALMRADLEKRRRGRLSGIDNNEKFNPVDHDGAFVAQLLSDPEAKRAYDELEDEYAALNAELRTRRG